MTARAHLPNSASAPPSSFCNNSSATQASGAPKPGHVEAGTQLRDGRRSGLEALADGRRRRPVGTPQDPAGLYALAAEHCSAQRHHVERPPGARRHPAQRHGGWGLDAGAAGAARDDRQPSLRHRRRRRHAGPRRAARAALSHPAALGPHAHSGTGEGRPADRFLRNAGCPPAQSANAQRGARAARPGHHHHHLSGGRCGDGGTSVRPGGGTRLEAVRRASHPSGERVRAAGLLRRAELAAVPSRQPVQHLDAAVAHRQRGAAQNRPRHCGHRRASTQHRRDRCGARQPLLPRRTLRAGASPRPRGAHGRGAAAASGIGAAAVSVGPATR